MNATIVLVGRLAFAVAILLAGASPGMPCSHPAAAFAEGSGSSPGPSGNFSAAINRLVELVAGAGSGILALVWARVALSWFSNDITKKVQAKDRARDALIGTLLFVAAVTGVVYGLAHWVVTGS
ncbi:MAG TPA: hypothetical protein VEH57_06375 [Thermoplasmata archaeon]|nr:hypothetical protein [Thermoplasmata archaeon]